LLPPFCYRCSEPLTAGRVCQRCAYTPLALTSIRSPFLMEGPIREAIHQLKYRNLRALAPTLAGLMAEYWTREGLGRFDCLVPVPLHRGRLRERGYNQSELLARGLSKLTGLPVVSGSLVRQRAGLPQARASSAEERRSSVQGAFLARGRGLDDKRVLLVDDVCTTGATLDACARALQEAGAKEILALTLAREV